MKLKFIDYINNIFRMIFRGKKLVKLGIYGPINVGKTTLANRICKDWIGEELGTVSKIPHETREIQVNEKVKIRSNSKELDFNIIDTPGIATKNPYNQVNITIIGNLAARNIPVLIVANKIDLKKAKLKRVQNAFPQYRAIGISAEKGKNMEDFYDALFELIK